MASEVEQIVRLLKIETQRDGQPPDKIAARPAFALAQVPDIPGVGARSDCDLLVAQTGPLPKNFKTLVKDHNTSARMGL